MKKYDTTNQKYSQKQQTCIINNAVWHGEILNVRNTFLHHFIYLKMEFYNISVYVHSQLKSNAFVLQYNTLSNSIWLISGELKAVTLIQNELEILLLLGLLNIILIQNYTIQSNHYIKTMSSALERHK